MTGETLDRARRLGCTPPPNLSRRLAAWRLFCDGEDPLAFENFLVLSHIAVLPCTWQVAGRLTTPHLVHSHLCILSYNSLVRSSVLEMVASE